jgi:hypothetical protein
MVVVPPTIGSFREPTDAPAVVIPPTVPEGWKLVETDEQGQFACPNPECDFVSDYERIDAG